MAENVSSSDSSEFSVPSRTNKPLSLWRPRSLVNLLPSAHEKKRERSLFSSPSIDSLNSSSSFNSFESRRSNKKGSGTTVNLVLVEAKDLPDVVADNRSHFIYCKIRLGKETFKSKWVPTTKRPQWRQRFKLHLHKDQFLRLSLWDKGREKNFMGSCVVDLLSLPKDRSHEIWRELDDGFGSIHLNISMCVTTPNAPANTSSQAEDLKKDMKNLESFFSYVLPSGYLEALKFFLSLFTFERKTTQNTLSEFFSNFRSNLNVVGQLKVQVMKARGLSGKPDAYCTLELDNERMQTHSARATAEPVWNKEFVFNVYDVTSTLEVKVCDKSIVNSLMSPSLESIGNMSSLGKVVIPLLRINNEEPKWYALKDRSKRSGAKGNCPRVLLQMNLEYNPIKASLKVFRPKQTRYKPKQHKFDLGLTHNNVLFMSDIMTFLTVINIVIKQFLEWENRELSAVVFIGWLVFWYYFQAWYLPLILLIPFVYFWVNKEKHQERTFMRGFHYIVDETDPNAKTEKSIANRILSVPDTAVTIYESIEYISSTIERLYNLVTFKVPFMSYLAMTLLVLASMTLYIVPANYLLMALGIYKYGRKYVNPDRELNNDVLDFISRVPDTEIWKDWKELNVPEPSSKNVENRLYKSASSDRLDSLKFDTHFTSSF